jgi:hypothetical protein
MLLLVAAAGEVVVTVEVVALADLDLVPDFQYQLPLDYIQSLLVLVALAGSSLILLQEMVGNQYFQL